MYVQDDELEPLLLNQCNHSVVLHPPVVLPPFGEVFYISSNKGIVYHTIKGHFNADIPIYKITNNMKRCTRCDIPEVVLDPSKTITVTTPVYISSERGRVYHTRKGHFNADIPIYKITNNLVRCTRC